MPFIIVRNDITKMAVDAVVAAANTALRSGGGVNGAIHRAAGPELQAECQRLGGCARGEAKITKAYRLPCKYVIHTVGPVWQGGGQGERDALVSCYRLSLELALEYRCETIAFPLISSGAYGYPKEDALYIAKEVICDFLQDHDITAYLVLFDGEAFQIGTERFNAIAAYIDQRYVERHTDSAAEHARRYSCRESEMQTAACEDGTFQKNLISEISNGATPSPPSGRAPEAAAAPIAAPKTPPDIPADWSLADALREIDEGFSQALLRLIDQRGMTDSQCYKKANISRKLFSKIRSNPAYRPSKPTAVAFAVALELSLNETEEFLRKAGFALSRSSKFDIIIEFFISRRCYNVLVINEALFAFDQPLLGG